MCDTDNPMETFRRSRCEINKLFHRIIPKCKFAYSSPAISHRHVVYSHARFINLLRDAKSRNVNFYVLGSFERLVLSRFKIIKHECDTIFSAIVLAYHFTLAYTSSCIAATLAPSPGFSIAVLRRRGCMKQE